MNDWSDLERVDGVGVERAERRVAGAEVVDVDAHAERPQASQHAGRHLLVLHDRALGDLEPDPARLHAVLGEDVADLVREAGVGELLARQVDADVWRRFAEPVAPAADVAADAVEDLLLKVEDGAYLLGERKNSYGGTGPLVADQRARASKPSTWPLARATIGW